MANLLKRGMQWLAGKLAEHASETVVYSRGGDSVTLTPTQGKTMLLLSDGSGGNRVEWTDADLIFPAEDLVLGGSATTPRRGDRVRYTEDGRTIVFEVMAADGEPPWRYCDGSRVLIRVHLKQIGVE